MASVACRHRGVRRHTKGKGEKQGGESAGERHVGSGGDAERGAQGGGGEKEEAERGAQGAREEGWSEASLQVCHCH